VELSPIAVEDFFKENDISFEVTEDGPFYVYRHSDLTIYLGDFFQLEKGHVEDVEVIYDRAALVALPEAMRRDYTEHLGRCMPDTEDILLVTMDYPQQEMGGPPFSVAEQEVHNLYAHHYDIHLLERFDVLSVTPRFRERGLTQMDECIYHMSRKS
jgi:thiopurine S-methyltransferase